jgi:hypothetical protein
MQIINLAGQSLYGGLTESWKGAWSAAFAEYLP